MSSKSDRAAVNRQQTNDSRARQSVKRTKIALSNKTAAKRSQAENMASAVAVTVTTSGFASRKDSKGSNGDNDNINANDLSELNFSRKKLNAYSFADDAANYIKEEDEVEPDKERVSIESDETKSSRDADALCAEVSSQSIKRKENKIRILLCDDNDNKNENEKENENNEKENDGKKQTDKIKSNENINIKKNVNVKNVSYFSSAARTRNRRVEKLTSREEPKAKSILIMSSRKAEASGHRGNNGDNGDDEAAMAVGGERKGSTKSNNSNKSNKPKEKTSRRVQFMPEQSQENKDDQDQEDDKKRRDKEIRRKEKSKRGDGAGDGAGDVLNEDEEEELRMKPRVERFLSVVELSPEVMWLQQQKLQQLLLAKSRANGDEDDSEKEEEEEKEKGKENDEEDTSNKSSYDEKSASKPLLKRQATHASSAPGCVSKTKTATFTELTKLSGSKAAPKANSFGARWRYPRMNTSSLSQATKADIIRNIIRNLNVENYLSEFRSSEVVEMKLDKL
jgi:hypothetical protein